MSADFIQGAVDGAGKYVATDSIVENSNTVHRQRVLVEGELLEAIESLRIAIGSLVHTIGLTMPDTAGRMRVLADASSAIGTVSTVTTVGTVTTASSLTNQVNVGGFSANDEIPSLMKIAVESIRRNITVS